MLNPAQRQAASHGQNDDEKPRLVTDLGSNTFLMLRNHGLLTEGVTIPDPFIHMYALETACQTQLAAQSAGVALTEINSKAVAGIKEQFAMVTGGMGGGLHGRVYCEN
jgi:ribulose-5-phosphate 4-epimerase/fuculose-1-phosphate aldolase